MRWRCVDLRDELERRFGVVRHERSVGKLLAELGYPRLSVRPRHPHADEEAQESFKKTSPRRSRHSSRARRRQGDRFQDEARIGEQGMLNRVWACATRPTTPGEDSGAA
jgi:hypothetical protein